MNNSSSARNRRRHRQNVQRQNMLLAARLGGCICEPDIKHVGPDHYALAHDEWCPMINHCSQIVLHNLDGGPIVGPGSSSGVIPD